MKILLKNGVYIDPTDLSFIRKDVVVDNNRLTFVEKDEEEYFGISEKYQVIDCQNKYITKSFGIAHHHAYSALALGMPSPAVQPNNFAEILERIWWNLDRCLDKESIELSAYVTAFSMIRNGSTFLIDHHSSPNYIKGSQLLMAEVFDRLGVGHILCYEITDRNGTKATNESLEETDEYLSKYQGLVGLHASFTLEDETLKKAYDLCIKHDTGIHIHVAEDQIDQTECQKRYGKRVLERLQSFGLLDFPKSILVHAIHLDVHEREILYNSPCWVVQNPESNWNNRVGHFDGQMLSDRIMIGTDGMNSNILQSARYAFFTQMEQKKVMLGEIYGRLRNIHRYVANNQFRADSDASLIVFSYNPRTEFTGNNFLGHLFYGMDSMLIADVISNGRIVMQDGKIIGVDEQEILRESRIASQKLWDRYLRC